MRQTFHRADFNALAALYREFAPAKYAVDSAILRQCTAESPLFDWGASIIEVDSNGQPEAFIAVKKSAGKVLYQGPDPETAHITTLAFRDPKLAVDLMHEVKTCLINRGIDKLAFGMDSRHMFPGCPIDFYQLRDYLIIEGFAEGGDYFDLERDLSKYQNSFPIPAGDVFRPVENTDLPELIEFFDREFPQRWKYDAMSKIGIEEEPGIVFGLFHGKKIDGFALLQWDGAIMPIAGAIWRESLGAKWGSLGPIGVSASLRGKGSGNALLGKALEYLRDRGAQRTIIDWTTLGKFYGAHGFEVSRTYRSMTLNLIPSM